MRSSDAVLGWVEQRLAAGTLRLGGRLPGERALAEELGISRAAAREGLRVLEALGVLRPGVGSGPTAGTIVVADPSLAFGRALRLHLATGHLTAQDVVDTRILLEGWAAAHVDASSDALDDASALLDRMSDERASVRVFLDLDAAFHVALAGAAGNPLVAAMMRSIRDAVQDYTAAIATGLPAWEPVATRLHGEHRAILSALRDGDGLSAASLVVGHIERYYRLGGPTAGG